MQNNRPSWWPKTWTAWWERSEALKEAEKVKNETEEFNHES